MNIFFFNDTATTEIYTLSLHDALPIFDYEEASPQLEESRKRRERLHALLDQAATFYERNLWDGAAGAPVREYLERRGLGDRKSTRLNSSHANISYAVFCLKKKKKLPTP